MQIRHRTGGFNRKELGPTGPCRPKYRFYSLSQDEEFWGEWLILDQTGTSENHSACRVESKLDGAKEEAGRPA